MRKAARGLLENWAFQGAACRRKSHGMGLAGTKYARMCAGRKRGKVTKPGKNLLFYKTIPKAVPSGGKVPLQLSQGERELIIEHTLADDELTAPLRATTASSEKAVYSFTLDDLEDLAGFVAAEANHNKNTKLQRELDRLCERINEVLDSYAD